MPFSTDGFMDCQAMVIAKGERDYQKVLADPTQMARQVLRDSGTWQVMPTSGKQARITSMR